MTSSTSIGKLAGKNRGTSRKGYVAHRSQVFNRLIGRFVKRDTVSGRFIGVKADSKPFKGVRRERA